ncbi:MAG: CoA transferase, partial [Deltaproteobacteria bacterium]|nr:CoA transferase [Deltaproteobacteria bacterium]
PVRVGFSVADLGAGLYTVIGILAALRERMVSGAGQYLDVSMLDTQIALMENAYTRYLATGEVPQPMGSRHPVITPFQAFPSRDGYLVLAMGTDEQWQSFTRHVGRPELGEDPRFGTVPARTAHREALEAILREITRTKTTAEWLATLEPIGIPCGPINTIPQVVADPHVQARRMFTEVEHRGVGRVRVVAPPLKFSRTPAAVRTSCPELGEDTEEVLRDLLGIPASEVARLRREGVI